MMRQANRLCSQCRRSIKGRKGFEIDGKYVCSTCLYGDAEPFEIYPIGTVKNDLYRNKVGFGTIGRSTVSRIELFPSQRPFLYKLEDEAYLTVVYYLHKSRPVKSVFKRGLDGKMTGVFATRTPDRLSKIGIQDVTLIKVEETTLYVENLDAIDGTPVLDIKLYWSSCSE